ncbi:MAG TPA: hypothetical protein VD769_03415 [Gaiellaceae bacterium]|nr:hypothetical protein [Gaiellaceae bacterium]
MARLALLGVLLALLAACGGNGDDADGAGAAGPVDVDLVVVTGIDTASRFVVRCDPTGGTTPDPEATCAAIAAHPEMLAPPPLESTCPGSLGSPPEVRLAGTVNGQPVEPAVRDCDEPEARADAARLWLEATGLSSG